jgi:N utilization substance protein A
MGEISGDRVDVISYDSNLAQYAINALAPAEIDSIVVDEDTHRIEVIVDDDKLGLAIGPDGVNVRLASKLVGCTINVYGKTDAVKQHDEVRDNLIHTFNEALDVDDDISEILVDHGFTSLEEVAYVDIKELTSLPDFDEDIAVELQERAKNKLLSKTLKHKDDMDHLALELNSIVKFSHGVLLALAEAGVKNINDFADLSGDELMEIIGIDLDTANKLILKARAASGYFD